MTRNSRQSSLCVDSTEFTRLLDMALLHDGSTSIAVVDENNELYQTGGKKAESDPQGLFCEED